MANKMFRVNFEWQPPKVLKISYDVDLPPHFVNRNAPDRKISIREQELGCDIFERQGLQHPLHSMRSGVGPLIPNPNTINASLNRKTGEVDISVAFFPKPSTTVMLDSVETEVFSRKDGSGRQSIHDSDPMGKLLLGHRGVHQYTTQIDLRGLETKAEDIWRLRVNIIFLHENDPVHNVATVQEGSGGSNSFLPDEAASCDHFKDFFGKKEYSDFILVSEDGWEFPVHRMILARESDFFKATFDLDFREKKEGKVEIPTSSLTLQNLLEWVYRKRVQNSNTDSTQKLLDLFSAADYCCLGVLKNSLLDHLLSNVNVYNALDLFRFAAGRQDGEDIAKAAYALIKKEKRGIFKTQEELAAFQAEFPNVENLAHNGNNRRWVYEPVNGLTL